MILTLPFAWWLWTRRRRLWERLAPDPRDTIQNRPAPLTMEQEAMGGESGPFFPSSVHVRGGGTVPASVYLKPESCARSGCHPDVFDQWESSAHHFSSFNNQWYRKSIEYLQETAGITPSKWCGGCHDPALLQSGMMDNPIEEIVHTPEAQAGLTCTACHMISSVRSSMGQGDYEITVPAGAAQLHRLPHATGALRRRGQQRRSRDIAPLRRRGGTGHGRRRRRCGAG